MHSIFSVCRRFAHLNQSIKYLTRFKSSGADISQTKKCLFRPISEPPFPSAKKVSVIGCGHAGITAAYAILRSGAPSELVLIDANEKKAVGEMMDLTHCSTFYKFPKIIGGSDMALTACSNLVVIAAGPSMKSGEVKNRLDLVFKNAELLNKLVPLLVEQSPDCIFLCITNPADMIAYITWKITGFPAYRVLSTGTDLKSSRVRREIAQRLGVNPYSVHGT